MRSTKNDSASTLGSLGNKLTTRRLVAILATCFVIAIALFGLWRPVYLDDYDTFGFQISCGTGISSDLTQVREDADKSSAHENDCFVATQLRRAWSIPLAIGGIALLTVLVLRGVRIHAPRPSTET